jgi:hypothetical protein
MLKLQRPAPYFANALLYAGFDIGPRFEKLVMQQVLILLLKATATI